MKLLIPGGAGYIGSHTAKLLLARGYDVTVIDSLETGFLEAVPKAASFYRGDIRSADFLKDVFDKERPDGVIHFAANSQVGESMTNPLKYYGNNLEGTRTLLEAMVRHGVKYIVFSSSAAAYGEPEHIPICEADRTAPTNCYGETKLAMEKMMKWTDAAHGLRYVALRYFNACGADPDGTIGEAHDPETHLIPLVMQVACGKRDRISVFGDDYGTPDGTCIRDYVHVCDLAQAHTLAMEYLVSGGKSDVFNLGSGTGFSVREVIETARIITGHPIPAVTENRRPGDPARLVASAEKAKEILHWQPQYSDLRQIIGTAWNWHRTHPDGYQ